MTGFILQVLNMFFMVLYILLFLRIILTWISFGRSNQLTELLFSLTEPFLSPLRGMVQASPLGGGVAFDLSPLIAFIIIRFFQGIITMLLMFS